MHAYRCVPLQNATCECAKAAVAEEICRCRDSIEGVIADDFDSNVADFNVWAIALSVYSQRVAIGSQPHYIGSDCVTPRSHEASKFVIFLFCGCRREYPHLRGAMSDLSRFESWSGTRTWNSVEPPAEPTLTVEDVVALEASRSQVHDFSFAPAACCCRWQRVQRAPSIRSSEASSNLYHSLRCNQ
jgi:hypothetical protein